MVALPVAFIGSAAQICCRALQSAASRSGAGRGDPVLGLASICLFTSECLFTSGTWIFAHRDRAARVLGRRAFSPGADPSIVRTDNRRICAHGAYNGSFAAAFGTTLLFHEPSALFVDKPLELDLDALAGRAAMAGAGGQELTRLLGGLGLDAPFFDARHHHPGVKQPCFRFCCGCYRLCCRHDILLANHRISGSLGPRPGRTKKKRPPESDLVEHGFPAIVESALL